MVRDAILVVKCSGKHSSRMYDVSIARCHLVPEKVRLLFEPEFFQDVIVPGKDISVAS
jgi:hypothetical protein